MQLLGQAHDIVTSFYSWDGTMNSHARVPIKIPHRANQLKKLQKMQKIAQNILSRLLRHGYDVKWPFEN